MAHAHPHAHRHAHGHHDHAALAGGDARRLTVALVLLGGLLVVEAVVGLLTGSLALLSDAAHMLTDVAALGLALVAIRLARRPAQGALTFGLRRAEVLSAQVNGATLLVLGVVIAVEGVRRLLDPPEVPGLPLLVVALLGVAVNVAATVVLAGANRDSLNVEGAFQHVLTDLVAFIATAVAGAVILLTGFVQADGLAALVVAVVMLRSAYGLLRATGRVLLEAAPMGVDVDAIGRAMASEPRVSEVHDLHVWEVASGFPALSAHVLVGPGDPCHDVRRELEALLHHRFGIDHTTLQVEHEGGDALLAIAPQPPARES